MARQHAAAAALFAALAVAMTWPLARNLGSAVAWPGDPFINIWILDWDFWATFHRPLSLFDANAFYPARYALAYSENLYGIALLLFPFRAAGVPPIAAYNLAMLLGYAFSGFGAYLLGRTVTASWWAGLAAGIFYAFLPFRITHAAHVQHVWAGWLPVMLVALLHYKAQPSWLRAALFAGAFLMNGLSNVHWLLFGALALAVTVAIVRPRLVPIATCTLAAALLLAPFLYPYAAAARTYDMVRGWHEAKSFSATPGDWLRANPTMRWYGALADVNVDPERWLFPGALGIALAAVALATRERRTLAVGLAWVALGFLGSLGTHAFLHRLLFLYVPGFRAIRVPARWANIAYVGMAVLIALGVRAIARDRRWVGALIAGAFVVELCAAPMLWYLAVPANPPVYTWMRDARPHAVLELPITQGNIDYSYMLRATAHHRPIVNGTSGFAPPERLRIEALVNASSDALLPELRRIGVSHIVVHGDAIGAATRAWLRRELDAGRIALVQRFDHGMNGDWVFATSGGKRAMPPQLTDFLAGRPTYSADTFGFVDLPLPGQRVERGHAAYISGFALSPFGIRSVTLCFANGAVRATPFLFDDPALRRRFPWYDATTRPRFLLEIPHRPPGVRERTDLQVEIIDGRGRRTLLEDRFFEWR